jgi:hypothetical protein
VQDVETPTRNLLLFTSSPAADNFIFPKDASDPTITNNDPSQYPAFTAGDKQVFTWAIDATSTRETTSIFTYRKSMGVRISFAVSCQLPNSLLSPQAANRPAICDGSSFTWNGQPTQDMILGNVFFLQMYDMTQMVRRFSSRGISISPTSIRQMAGRRPSPSPRSSHRKPVRHPLPQHPQQHTIRHHPLQIRPEQPLLNLQP